MRWAVVIALAADRNGGTHRLGVADEHLRLDRLALQRVLDDLLHRARRAPSDLYPAGIGHRDRAVPADHLLGDGGAVGAGRKFFERGGRGEQSAGTRLPDCHRQHVANADHRLGGEAVVSESSGEARQRPAAQKVDGRGIDVDQLVGVVVCRSIDHSRRARARGRDLRAARQEQPRSDANERRQPSFHASRQIKKLPQLTVDVTAKP